MLVIAVARPLGLIANRSPESAAIVDFVHKSSLGRVQRGIWRAFTANPGRLLSTRELAAWGFPRLQGELQNKHPVSLCRAARRVAVRVRRGSSRRRRLARSVRLRNLQLRGLAACYLIYGMTW
jgi:hypothetical protein